MSLRKKARDSLEEPEFEEIREIPEERTRSAPGGPSLEDSRAAQLAKDLDAVKASMGEKDRELAKRDRETAAARDELAKARDAWAKQEAALASKLTAAEANLDRLRR